MVCLVGAQILQSGQKKEEPGRSGIMRSIAAEYGISYFAWDRYDIRLEEE